METDQEMLADDCLTPITPRPDDLLKLSPREPLPGEPDTPGNLDTDDSTDSTPYMDPEPLPFPEFSTSLLDSSAQLSKAELGRRRNRRSTPSWPVRHGTTLSNLQEATDGPSDWKFRDTKVIAESCYGRDSLSEEGPCLKPSQMQRVPIFPGMDPSALKAVLQKRGGDSDGQADSPAPSSLELLRRTSQSSHPPTPQLSCPAPSPSQFSCFTKSPLPPAASRVLPPAAGTENRQVKT
ncbi:hypothetical protein SKAU_G00376180 [Synaphobranchus kaupii]|uniref:Tankyrase 1-binding protein C-terminal domain-containing protein n=1 Tax=Synaphobranchus kaupii TaxID=118154 RepID=A0A9Q1ECU3_SYNKA|nr:hypothetical protein SKAU_G00376180 [Synaphobranchus kaupii]